MIMEEERPTMSSSSSRAESSDGEDQHISFRTSNNIQRNQPVRKLYEQSLEQCATVQNAIILSLLYSLYHVWWHEDKIHQKNKKKKKAKSRRKRRRKCIDNSGDSNFMSGMYSLSDLSDVSWSDLEVFSDDDDDDDDEDDIMTYFDDDISQQVQNLLHKWERETDIDHFLQSGFDTDSSSDTTSTDRRNNSIFHHDVYTDYEYVLLTHSILLGCNLCDMNTLLCQLVLMDETA